MFQSHKITLPNPQKLISSIFKYNLIFVISLHKSTIHCNYEGMLTFSDVEIYF